MSQNIYVGYILFVIVFVPHFFFPFAPKKTQIILLNFIHEKKKQKCGNRLTHFDIERFSLNQTNVDEHQYIKLA